MAISDAGRNKLVLNRFDCSISADLANLINPGVDLVSEESDSGR